MSVESSGPAACLLLDAGEGRLVMTVPMDLLNPAIVDIGPEACLCLARLRGRSWGWISLKISLTARWPFSLNSRS